VSNKVIQSQSGNRINLDESGFYGLDGIAFNIKGIVPAAVFTVPCMVQPSGGCAGNPDIFFIARQEIAVE
jgi:hypothetical protein